MANFIEISSKDNQLIKFVSQLQTSAKHRKENNLFVLEGLRICDDAYQNNIRFDKLIVTKAAIEKHGETIELFASVSNSCYILREDLFKKISDTNSPQGIIAVAEIPKLLQCISTNGRYIVRSLYFDNAYDKVLREKIDGVSQNWSLKTVWGVGYKFEVK